MDVDNQKHTALVCTHARVVKYVREGVGVDICPTGVVNPGTDVAQFGVRQRMLVCHIVHHQEDSRDADDCDTEG